MTYFHNGNHPSSPPTVKHAQQVKILKGYVRILRLENDALQKRIDAKVELTKRNNEERRKQEALQRKQALSDEEAAKEREEELEKERESKHTKVHTHFYYLFFFFFI